MRVIAHLRIREQNGSRFLEGETVGKPQTGGLLRLKKQRDDSWLLLEVAGPRKISDDPQTILSFIDAPWLRDEANTETAKGKPCPTSTPKN